MEWLDKIPNGIWNILAGLIGWFSKTIFDAWQKSRRPFKQDKERYEAVINAIDPVYLHYFREAPLNSIESRATDSLHNAFYVLSSIRKRKPKYLHKKLDTLESELFDALADVVYFLSMNLFPHRMRGDIYTMYWDNFDELNRKHREQFQKIKNELMRKIDRLIAAFEAFRDEGNRLFAEKLVKENSDS
ncbi:hypothetical protein [Thermopetrobacter sp. TC1]|uniref:hypothetical protein n=1 Tax=Thermopetrobacter sp. TC1 TaxID=1495045 RepID=UPI00056F85EF|nr:hypothetical protein [Thermopetrobacter sp. TC1]